MKTLDALISHIKSREDVTMFQSLEASVLTNPAYKAAYNEVLNLQKQLVQAKHDASKKADDIEGAYKRALDALQNTPAVAQYLALQDELNTMLDQIIKLIEAALSKPFEQ